MAATRPTPNFFSAARRVTDWAMLLVSSSNLLFILFLSVVLVCRNLGAEVRGVAGRRPGAKDNRPVAVLVGPPINMGGGGGHCVGLPHDGRRRVLEVVRIRDQGPVGKEGLGYYKDH